MVCEAQKCALTVQGPQTGLPSGKIIQVLMIGSTVMKVEYRRYQVTGLCFASGGLSGLSLSGAKSFSSALKFYCTHKHNRPQMISPATWVNTSFAHPHAKLFVLKLHHLKQVSKRLQLFTLSCQVRCTYVKPEEGNTAHSPH